VLSDGNDNASRQSESNMRYRAALSDALIYTIWTGDLAGEAGNPGLLRKLAASNGGLAYRPKSETDVTRAFTAIGDNIRRGYSLGYVPRSSNADGSYRRIRVIVRHEGRTLNVRVRDGYTAPDRGAR
jgi:VWFA-related protein